MTASLSFQQRLIPDGVSSDALASEIFGSLRVSMPAIVQSFDETTQTVVVQCALLQNLRVQGVQQNVDLGLISDVPIILPTGGGWSLTLPIQAGDECDLIFADGCIDAWFQSGGQQTAVDGRRHALPDAIAIFGVRSQPRRLANYSTTAAQLRSDDGNTVIELGAGEITIKANNVSVQAQQVTVSGSTNVHITGAGNTTIEGKNFLAHTHSGVQAGGGVTGPVV